MNETIEHLKTSITFKKLISLLFYLELFFKIHQRMSQY